MTFSLAQQNLEAGSPWPVSSANCTGTQKLDPTAEGLIGVGTVLGVLILVLVLYSLYRCWIRPHRDAISSQPTVATKPESVITHRPTTQPAVYDAESIDGLGMVGAQPHLSRENSHSSLVEERRNEMQA